MLMGKIVIVANEELQLDSYTFGKDDLRLIMFCIKIQPNFQVDKDISKPQALLSTLVNNRQ